MLCAIFAGSAAPPEPNCHSCGWCAVPQGSSLAVVRRVAQQVLVTLRFLLRCAGLRGRQLWVGPAGGAWPELARPRLCTWHKKAGRIALPHASYPRMPPPWLPTPACPPLCASAAPPCL